jgi:hypothetical protein
LLNEIALRLGRKPQFRGRGEPGIPLMFKRKQAADEVISSKDL